MSDTARFLGLVRTPQPKKRGRQELSKSSLKGGTKVIKVLLKRGDKSLLKVGIIKGYLGGARLGERRDFYG
ncbi:MAG: hypothetical protein EAZ60_22710 [Oscillatoriales cyanobacterium]|nr:MAG: hypothetical protein EAZ83_28410 [Oscillatoriales cyanobacterium]TAE97879.1 MAG: hypothetical protein EAZ79_09450 [Oscillatoriales cyanobacterium]TAF14564.1 MAG: hypothetical protein EAZ73_28760 [Oscillatoriales cyanobacterium]TAF29047.1 MAG: hypothetical protein EAZ69_25720 [Oscillatoriales cyanobacterium]TAF52783.1 MAG: hypothetical protein EAZ60_22710 [Oscillatoriales cyanobacterium]